MKEATEKGASIHEQLLQKLAPVEEVAETTDDTVTEEVTEDESQVEDESEVSEEDQPETQEADDESDGEALELPVLAEYLGLDADKLDVNESGELYVKTKVDGEEGQATLNDLIKSYQLEGHLNKQNMEVAELKKKLNTQLEESNQQVNDKLQKAEDLLAIAYHELTSDYESVNWKELRDEDQSEYAVKQIEYQNRQNQIAQLYQQIQDNRQQTQVADSTVSQEKLQSEKAKLVAAMGWGDNDQSKKEFTDISTYAVNTGLSQDEFNQIANHQLIVMMSKAMKYDALQKDNPRVTNKVKKAPKLVKPGAAKPKQASESDEIRRLRKNVKANQGQKGSIAEYLLKTGRI